VSYHNFTGTPTIDELLQVVDCCKAQNADIVKLVTTANSQRDAARTLSLYDLCSDVSLVTFAMGAAGAVTRLACLLLGAPYTYAALADDKPLADGQLSAARIKAGLSCLQVNSPLLPPAPVW
jgi:3-dehydroquinate dehydratase-1